MIRVIEDVAAPATVTAVDLITLEVAPDWNEYFAYGLTALGYLGGWLGFGGNYVKNLGVASLPLTARHIRDRVKGGIPARVGSSRLSFRASPGAYGGPIRQTTVPELEGVRIS